MSRKILSQEQVEKLKQNIYILSISKKSITYTNEFKIRFIDDSNNGMSSREIFEKAGFDIDILGLRRIESAGSCWCHAYKIKWIIGLDDTRRNHSCRPRKHELTEKEIVKKQSIEE